MKKVILTLTIGFCLGWFPTELSAREKTKKKAVAISASRPEYPYQARVRRIMGSGVYVFHINPQGLVTKGSIAQSSGSKILDDAAVSAFRHWRFKPGSPPLARTPVTWSGLGRIRYPQPTGANKWVF